MCSLPAVLIPILFFLEGGQYFNSRSRKQARVVIPNYNLSTQTPRREAGGSFKAIKDSRPACDYSMTISKNNPEIRLGWSSEVEKGDWK